jgi:hypothetical protein
MSEQGAAGLPSEHAVAVMAARALRRAIAQVNKDAFAEQTEVMGRHELGQVVEALTAVAGSASELLELLAEDVEESGACPQAYSEALISLQFAGNSFRPVVEELRTAVTGGGRR